MCTVDQPIMLYRMLQSVIIRTVLSLLGDRLAGTPTERKGRQTVSCAVQREAGAAEHITH